MLGKLVGLVMKSHKDDVDGDLLRQVAAARARRLISPSGQVYRGSIAQRNPIPCVCASAS
jgi:hypothetical protein